MGTRANGILILTNRLPHLLSENGEACENSNYIWMSVGMSDFCMYEISEQASRHNQFQMQVKHTLYKLKIIFHDRNINIILTVLLFPLSSMIEFAYINWAYTYTYLECHNLFLYSTNLDSFSSDISKILDERSLRNGSLWPQ